MLRVLGSYLWLRIARPMMSPARYQARLIERHRRNARRVQRAIVDAGGLFIKVGQLISILSNVLPPEFRGELESLQDRLPPRPYEEVAARIRADFGHPAEELFREIDPVPIATASLAQVHQAWLHDGRKVAVKAQHRDIERIAREDLELIRRLLRIIQFVTGVRGLESYHPEISQMINEELDFAREAQNLRRSRATSPATPACAVPRSFRGCRLAACSPRRSWKAPKSRISTSSGPGPSRRAPSPSASLRRTVA